MKNLQLLIIGIVFLSAPSFAQVAINTNGNAAVTSAILDVNSTSKGILIPRLTTNETNSINSPAIGLLVYNTTTKSFWYFDTEWIEIITSVTSSINNLTDGKNDGLNLFLGNDAGMNNIGLYNTAIGIEALKANNSGYYNTSIGYHALLENTSGSENSTIGAYSLVNNTTGVLNVAFGNSGLQHNTTGSCNTGIGNSANANNEEGWNNTIIGYEAGKGTFLHNKSGNIFLGYKAGYNETGSYKLYIENSNSSTPLIGGDFLNDSIFFNGVVRITGGSPGAEKILTSDENGNSTWETPQWGATELNDLSDASTHLFNLFVGNNAGIATTSFHNTGLGLESLQNNTTGGSNTAVGRYTLTNNVNGSSNIAMGFNALFSNVSGSSNVAIGNYALQDNSSGDYNTAIGMFSLYFNTISDYNCAIGYEALKNNTEEKNTAIGAFASGRNTIGNQNVSIGYGSCYYNQAGSYNTSIGFEAGKGSSDHNKSGNIFLGYQAGYNETGSNKLYIENSNSDSPLIGGNFDTDQVYFNTDRVGVGTSIPREILEVASRTNSYGRMIVSDGGGDNRNVILFVSPTLSNQTARIEAFNYGTGSGLTLNFNTAGNGNSIFGGNILPESHKTKNLGGDGQAWNNVYAHNYVTQGSAAFADTKLTKQIIEFPPVEKPSGAFDEFTEKGLKELDPTSLPDALKDNNAILIDEMTTYNYKANYEQQLQIEELLITNKHQQEIINELIIRLNQLENK